MTNTYFDLPLLDIKCSTGPLLPLQLSINLHLLTLTAASVFLYLRQLETKLDVQVDLRTVQWCVIHKTMNIILIGHERIRTQKILSCTSAIIGQTTLQTTWSSIPSYREICDLSKIFGLTNDALLVSKNYCTWNDTTYTKCHTTYQFRISPKYVFLSLGARNRPDVWKMPVADLIRWTGLKHNFLRIWRP